eukprot:CAMPEP_0185794926 /NCGR_PEP_ID=MMETSP1174-20130828/160272_1 /TAXON_ID=35687 /ORGANISM="Dictyocha speculum, Strain CCMP1381" /LENGTH=42 /DNA_ID= /DNA_START= /DNA_END= /DNA_ORIENTATION=
MAAIIMSPQMDPKLSGPKKSTVQPGTRAQVAPYETAVRKVPV